MTENARKVCLVLMPFAEQFTEIYEQVYRPTCEALAVRCWRVDEVAGPGTITADIINGVVDSHFLIADLTAQNSNVFYELGIAHALSKEVILTCQTIEDVPFDVRGNRVIIYNQSISGAEKLKQDLTRAIQSIAGASLPVSNPVQDALRLRSLADNRILHERREGGRLIPPNSAVATGLPKQNLSARIDAARMDTAIARLLDALERIVDRKKKEDKIIIEVRGRAVYLQFAADKQEKHVYGEAVSNENLEGAEYLSHSQIEQLLSDGWTAPDGSDFTNFHREWVTRDSHDLRMIALETARALADVYDVRNFDHLRIKVFE